MIPLYPFEYTYPSLNSEGNTIWYVSPFLHKIQKDKSEKKNEILVKNTLWDQMG